MGSDMQRAESADGQMLHDGTEPLVGNFEVGVSPTFSQTPATALEEFDAEGRAVMQMVGQALAEPSTVSATNVANDAGGVPDEIDAHRIRGINALARGRKLTGLGGDELANETCHQGLFGAASWRWLPAFFAHVPAMVHDVKSSTIHDAR
jgi:diadenosine tetraphosphatase ApaH/serine/threonine PP2A family protein phosphatase